MDIGWTELMLIAVVALIVIGPRDLPHVFRALGRITGKMRMMAREFSSAMEDAARDSGLDEATKSLKDVRDLTSARGKGMQALDRAVDRFEKWEPKIPSARAQATPDPAAGGAPAGDGVTPASAPPAEPARPDDVPASAAPPPPPPASAAPAGTGQRRLHAVRRSDAKES
ncbi:MAG: Sec-independent protein translocase protein TatB [Paracoccus sp. (in: a-proteobacteria)]|nr:Sec-independent protein translocase protein TatB [Paracoccus sp. (in: a-proteobacteria)]